MELNMSVLTILALIFSVTTACFITNCPPGGKRSLPLHDKTQKHCTRCGPSGSGRCFGPDICCGEEIGCHFRNQITEMCRTEDYNPHPCRNEGRVCDNGKGICAIDAVCCSEKGCTIDKLCMRNHLKTPVEDTLEGKWAIDRGINW